MIVHIEWIADVKPKEFQVSLIISRFYEMRFVQEIVAIISFPPIFYASCPKSHNGQLMIYFVAYY